MLRLNIRCLNNQARFEPRGRREATKGRKDRERKNKREQDGGVKAARMLVFARSRVRETKRKREREREKKRAWFPSGRKRERERERKRRRRRFRFRPSGNRTRSPPFLVFDPRQFPLSPPPLRYVLHRARPLDRPACRIPPRRPYAKCMGYTYYAKRVTVGGLGSQTRTV